MPETCAYCTQANTGTKDHVFPRSWFPDSTPLDVTKWTVPCCAGCNNEKSRLENYSLQRLAACIDTSSNAATGIWEKVFRGLNESAGRDAPDREKRRRAHKAYFREIANAEHIRSSSIVYFSEAALPGRLMLRVKWKKVMNLMEMFARGCHFYLEQETLPTDSEVRCYMPRSYADIESVLSLLKQTALYELGPGIAFRRAHIREAGESYALYALQFWGGPIFFVTAFPAKWAAS